MSEKKIGLCLSGGGVRALVFHLGFLEWLAKAGLWNQVTFISTVSGGSLGTALVVELAGRKWPDQDCYLNHIQPEIKKLLTTWDLEGAYKWSLFLRPWLLFRGRAFVIAHLIRKHWKITSNVNQMPATPRWIINTTCYETGKNFRYTNNWMGDYIAGYVLNPDFPLAEAAAASAAVPGLIGPLSVGTKHYAWMKYPPSQSPEDKTATPSPTAPINHRLQLWDGGVYDNLGSEFLYKTGEDEFRDGVDFLLVSDASRPLGLEFNRFQGGIPPYIAPIRLVDAATDQVRALRARAIVGLFEAKPGIGAYLRMGNTAAQIYAKAGQTLAQRPNGIPWLPESEVSAPAAMETTLRQLTPKEYDQLHAHGFEVANATCNTRVGFPLL